MTFFNKKTEVMQIEMTPYGRYLYSIGKFMPHSYEFVDDDIIYRVSGSGETQEAAHSRILEQTPKLKINRSFQDEAPQVESPPVIEQQRVMVRKNNLRQADTQPMGRSAYSGSNIPQMQVTMLQGVISGSQMSVNLKEVNDHGVTSDGGTLLIPQVDIKFKFIAEVRDAIDPQDDYDGESIQSAIFDDGTYVDVRYQEPIIHLKEFNSFYEKENFEMEVFLVSGSSAEEVLVPLRTYNPVTSVKNDILILNEPVDDPNLVDEDSIGVQLEVDSFLEYFFDLQVDTDIPSEVLCRAVNSLEINNQFLDEELICPDQRTDMFDIYGTRVNPEDLEDCD